MNNTAIDLMQGADMEFELQMLNDNGTIKPVDTCSKFGIAAIHEGGTIISKWSLNSGTGWLPLDFSNASTGKVKVKLRTTETNTSPLGKIYFEVWARFPDVTYTDDSQFDIIEKVHACNIVKSTISTLPLP